MRRIIMGFAVLSVLISSPVIAAEVKNHPAVTPYAGSVATRRDDDGFRSYALVTAVDQKGKTCLLYTSPSPRDRTRSRMPSSA